MRKQKDKKTTCHPYDRPLNPSSPHRIGKRSTIPVDYMPKQKDKKTTCHSPSLNPSSPHKVWDHNPKTKEFEELRIGKRGTIPVEIIQELDLKIESLKLTPVEIQVLKPVNKTVGERVHNYECIDQLDCVAALINRTLKYESTISYGSQGKNFKINGNITFSDHQGLYLELAFNKQKRVSMYYHSLFSDAGGGGFAGRAAISDGSIYVKDYIVECLATQVCSLNNPDFLVFGELAFDRKEGKTGPDSATRSSTMNTHWSNFTDAWCQNKSNLPLPNQNEVGARYTRLTSYLYQQNYFPDQVSKQAQGNRSMVSFKKKNSCLDTAKSFCFNDTGGVGQYIRLELRDINTIVFFVHIPTAEASKRISNLIEYNTFFTDSPRTQADYIILIGDTNLVTKNPCFSFSDFDLQVDYEAMEMTEDFRPTNSTNDKRLDRIYIFTRTSMMKT